MKEVVGCVFCELFFGGKGNLMGIFKLIFVVAIRRMEVIGSNREEKFRGWIQLIMIKIAGYFLRSVVAETKYI